MAVNVASDLGSSSVNSSETCKERVCRFLGRHEVKILVGVAIVGGILLCLSGVGLGALGGGLAAAGLAKVILISSGAALLVPVVAYGAAEIIRRERMSRNTYFVLACNKSNRTTRQDQQGSLGDRYGGLCCDLRLPDRAKVANDYSPEQGEEEIVKDIRKLRKMLADYSSSGFTEFLVNDLEQHVARLSESEAKDVIYDGRGRSSFCLNGGTSNHSVIYEFVRESNGTFSFVIYNTGEGLDYEHFHGKVAVPYGSKIYQKTRVQIQGLTEGHLKNREFLRFLIKSHEQFWGPNMEGVYAGINNYLQGGIVKINPLEKTWQTLNEKVTEKQEEKLKTLKSQAEYRTLTDEEQKSLQCLEEKQKKGKQTEDEEERLQFVMRDLLQDPDFGPTQQLGTCVESSANAVEKFLFPSSLARKILKKMHIQELEAYQTRYKGSIFADIRTMNDLADQKLKKLQESVGSHIEYDQEEKKYFRKIDVEIRLDNGLSRRYELRVMAGSSSVLESHDSEGQEFLDRVISRIRGLIESGKSLPLTLKWYLDKDKSPPPPPS